MNHVCPVCGYNKLWRPAKDYLICPSCGTEFDYHDAVVSHAELRQIWLAAGAKWHSRSIAPPPDWDPFQQLVQAGYMQPDTLPPQQAALVVGSAEETD